MKLRDDDKSLGSLVSHYIEASQKFEAEEVGSDSYCELFCDNILTPLEEEISSAPINTKDDAEALLYYLRSRVPGEIGGNPGEKYTSLFDKLIEFLKTYD